jgi:hypothetical protein
LGSIGPAVSEEIIFKWFFAEFSIFTKNRKFGKQSLNNYLL